ncbi:TetR/AcrR family transcriptional regulator [Streptomyces sp. NPDC091292]|uniref:TetR/AcrR family transcriptional regulator n=1 Tax=Streptomyces sp. NPDC091292 TaxID=3365991 RepID=UPI0037F38C89
MRPSSKTHILEAAVRVVERAGITALTLDAAAEEAGLTKPGLMYHFRTRDALLVAIQRHLTEEFHGHLLAELGKPFDESTPRERAAAYVRFGATSGASKAELAFMVQSATEPELARVWDELAERWVPEPSDPDPDAVELFLARMAADGLWLFRATTEVTLSPEVKDAVRRRMIALTEPRTTARRTPGGTS